MHHSKLSIFFRLWALILGLLSISPLWASEQTIQSRESIREHVRQFLLQRATVGAGSHEVVIKVNAMDARLRLSLCDKPLEAFLPPSARASGRVTVGVRCTGSKPWSLYVPAGIQQFDQVVVAKRHIKRGGLVTRADLTLERQDLTRLRRGYFLHPDDVLGLIAERGIRHGTTLTPHLLEQPMAVKRGARVVIIARIGGIEARMKGKSLDNGSLGEQVRVKNLSSKKELEARVISAGLVRVDI